ncbi:MAG TPA: hypothetical protein VFH80_04550 [Solirubrobacteraceae bacterium]|nr:hypothetical protein [Solirubrobacteraceae bacterium]
MLVEPDHLAEAEAAFGRADWLGIPQPAFFSGCSSSAAAPARHTAAPINGASSKAHFG